MVGCGGMTGRVHEFCKWTRLVVLDEMGSGTGVDLVGVDVLVEGFANGLVEAGKQLGQCFSVAAYQHGQGVVLIAGYGDAADGVLIADR